jgi:hypothetical protein
MNLLELSAMLGYLAGAVEGFRIGGRVGAVPGAILGLLVGSVAGILTTPLATLGLVSAYTAFDRARYRRGLSRPFGRYWDRDRTLAWRRLKDTLRGGQPVRGKVLAVRSSNLFIDVGAGFPVSLPSWEVDGRCARRPRIGDEAEALVLRFDDAEREIVATTRPRHWIVWQGTQVGYAWCDPSAAEPDAVIPCEWLTNAARRRLEHLLYDTEGVSCALVRGDDLPSAPYRGCGGPASSARVWVELRRNRLTARQPPLPPSTPQSGSGTGLAQAECGSASIAGPATQLVLPPKLAE